MTNFNGWPHHDGIIPKPGCDLRWSTQAWSMFPGMTRKTSSGRETGPFIPGSLRGPGTLRDVLIIPDRCYRLRATRLSQGEFITFRPFTYKEDEVSLRESHTQTHPAYMQHMNVHTRGSTHTRTMTWIMGCGHESLHQCSSEMIFSLNIPY